MSVEAVTWALYEAPMLRTEAGNPDSTARQVLVVYAERADKFGCSSYPGAPLVSEATGLDERTVERAVRRLETAGLLIRDGLSKYGNTNWRLNLAAKRPESERESLRIGRDAEKRRQSKLRQERRLRAAEQRAADD